MTDEERELNRRALGESLDAFRVLSWVLMVLGAAICLNAFGVIGSGGRSGAGTLLGIVLAGAGLWARRWHRRAAIKKR